MRRSVRPASIARLLAALAVSCGGESYQSSEDHGPRVVDVPDSGAPDVPPVGIPDASVPDAPPVGVPDASAPEEPPLGTTQPGNVPNRREMFDGKPSEDAAQNEIFVYFPITPHDLDVPWRGYVLRIDKASGATAVIVDDLPDPISVTVHGDHVYIGDRVNHTVERVRLDGSGRVLVASNIGTPTDMVTDGEWLWIADVGGNRVHRVTLDGFEITVVSQQHYPHTTLLVDDQLFTTNSTNAHPLVGQIVELYEEGGQRLFLEHTGWVEGLSERDGAFYWLNYVPGGSSAKRTDRQTSETRTLASLPDQPMSLDFFGSHLILGIASGLFRLHEQGGALEPLDTTVGPVRTLITDDRHAYYSGFGGVYRLPLE
jgi:sugar lactone lactonase YvrE